MHCHICKHYENFYGHMAILVIKQNAGADQSKSRTRYLNANYVHLLKQLPLTKAFFNIIYYSI